MELGEKLQELRKSKGMTQEELAQAIYVSRTAVSKWESGRGYPSIDSLKALAAFFSVSVDELLSAEKIVYIAEEENRSNIRSICGMLFGIADLLTAALAVLPLYPNTVAGEVYAVSLFQYSQTTPLILAVHWILYSLLFAAGGTNLLLRQFKAEKVQKAVTAVSVALGIVTVIFLALTREAYATTAAFILLIVKGLLVLKASKQG